MRAQSLGEQAATLHGWQNLSQALLASNEFMHLD
jgi:hypothetical protein